MLNLATMLSLHGLILAGDFDPQRNLSQWMGFTNLSNSATLAETSLPDTERVIVREIISPPVNEDRSVRGVCLLRLVITAYLVRQMRSQWNQDENVSFKN